MKRPRPRSALLVTAIVAASIGGSMANASSHTQVVTYTITPTRSLTLNAGANGLAIGNVARWDQEGKSSPNDLTATYKTDATGDRLTAQSNTNLDGTYEFLFVDPQGSGEDGFGQGAVACPAETCSGTAGTHGNGDVDISNSIAAAQPLVTGISGVSGTTGAVYTYRYKVMTGETAGGVAYPATPGTQKSITVSFFLEP
jgi:hypothetical protein